MFSTPRLPSWLRDRGVHGSDLVIAALLAGISAVIAVALWNGLGLLYPAGSDVTIWSRSAFNLGIARPSLGAPAYPIAVRLIGSLTGVDPLQAGVGVARLSIALAGPATYTLARMLGATRPAAVVVALLVLVEPHVASLGAQMQPDATALLALTLAPCAALAYLRQPTWGRFAVLVLVTAAAALVRAQLLFFVLPMAAVIALAPTTPAQRLLRVALLAAGLALAILAVVPPDVPKWPQPWLARLAMPVTDLTASGTPKYWTEFGTRDELDAVYRQGLIQRVAFYGKAALTRAPALWLWWAAGTAAGLILGRRRRIVVLAVMFCALPALFVHSKDRHVIIVLPALAAAFAAFCSSRRSRTAALSALAAGVLIWGLTLGAWGPRTRALREQASRTHQLSAFGKTLCAQLEPGAIGDGDLDAFLSCPIPTSFPWNPGTNLEWKVVWAGSEPPPGLGPLAVGNDLFPVYRLRPDLQGPDRPCYASVPVNEVWAARETRRTGDWPMEPSCEPGDVRRTR